MKAILNTVVLKEVKEEVIDNTGLILSQDDLSNRFGKGTVISKGDNAKAIEVNDVVLFDRSRQSKITVSGEELIIVEYPAVTVIL